MIELNIPGMGIVQLEHLVSDVNGTLAIDGQLLDGLSRVLIDLRDRLEVHILTADTHGRQDIIDQQKATLTAIYRTRAWRTVVGYWRYKENISRIFRQIRDD